MARWWSRGSADPSAPHADHSAPPSPGPPSTVVQRAAWRDAAPLTPTVTATAAIAPLDTFTGSLATAQNPSFLRPLAHAVDPAGPGGLVDGLAAPVAPQTISQDGRSACGEQIGVAAHGGATAARILDFPDGPDRRCDGTIHRAGSCRRAVAGQPAGVGQPEHTLVGSGVRSSTRIRQHPAIRVIATAHAHVLVRRDDIRHRRLAHRPARATVGSGIAGAAADVADDGTGAGDCDAPAGADRRREQPAGRPIDRSGDRGAIADIDPGRRRVGVAGAAAGLAIHGRRPNERRRFPAGRHRAHHRFVADRPGPDGDGPDGDGPDRDGPVLDTARRSNPARRRNPAIARGAALDRRCADCPATRVGRAAGTGPTTERAGPRSPGAARGALCVGCAADRTRRARRPATSIADRTGSTDGDACGGQCHGPPGGFGRAPDLGCQPTRSLR